jgi:type IV secretory pathway TraG/TraD family ATPase VirD4
VSTNVILQGTSLAENALPTIVSDAKVRLNGLFNGHRASFSLDEDILSKHTLLVGGTGCGKSNLFYHFVKQIKSELTNEDVMIIFDSKGDFHDIFKPNEDDIVIGNSTQYRNYPTRWNIFKEIVADGWDDRNIIQNSQEICKAFFEERVSKNSSNPFFPNAARDVLASILVAYVRWGIHDDVWKKENFYNDKFKSECLDEFSQEEIVFITSKKHSDLRKIETYIGGKGSKQAEGVLAEMYSVVDDIFRGVFAEHGNFSIRNFVREKGGKTLYIEYDLSAGSVLGPIYSLLFDLALKEAMGRNKKNGNVYLIVDELKLLPHLQHIDDGINFGRSLGVKILAGLQSIEQLYADYEEPNAKNIVAGFSSIYSYRANDPRTREYVRDLFGENVIMDRWHGTDKMLKDGVPRTGHTVEDWDLRRLNIGEAVVGLPGNEPFKFQFDLYRG